MQMLIASLVFLLASPVLYAKQDMATVNQACLQNGVPVCQVISLTRYQLENGIAHYDMVLKVGFGQRDVIGLHRVVKEANREVQPINAKATFMVHGDAYGFGSFISSANSDVVPHDHSIAIQMAMSGIDVWGIDLRWTKVAADSTNVDFSFMKNWGLTTDLKDLGVAITAARNIRRLQNNVDTKFNMLGWSRGGQLGYLYLAKEAQQRANTRNIKSFIPVDILVKTDEEPIRQAACTYADSLRSQWASGQYADESGLITQQIAMLAQSLPNEPSPFVEGMTNEQVALLLLTSTYVLSPPGGTYTPWYHYNGGVFDDSGLPTGLAFSKLNYLYEYATGAAPYEPIKLLAEATELTCNSGYGVLDKDLGRINVPMLYVNAAGGIGSAGVYTMKLTAHPDKSVLGIQTLPDELAALDFGHVDLFTATDADTRVWRNIIAWIYRH